ncbi:MAG: ABC transporter permease [Psychrobacillus psychrotolerans]|uniref:ABC transporter permease n=1 Tax=Psychrobacillus psychrotolerans TaxID=126156 RepID=UPI003BAFD1BA
MSGDGIVWLILLLLILLFDGTAIHLHKNNKLSLWISGIIMVLLVPIIGFTVGAIFLKISRVVDPTDTHEGSAFAAAFIAMVLLANALIFFITGIVLIIVRFFKTKKS